MEEILNSLIDKKFNYRDKVITIKSWKKINSSYVVISDKRTYNFYESEINGFISSLIAVRVELKQGVLEKRQIELNTKKMENTVVNKDVVEQDEFDIKAVLIDAIKEVKYSPKYIPQANTICNITSQLISLKKIEYLMQSKK